MKLPPLTVHRPTSSSEALALLAELGEEAAVYAGGTELLLVMKLGLAQYRHLVDLKGIGELRTITVENGHVRIGAAATHREITSHQAVRANLPEFARMIEGVGNLRVRSTGTLGGNLAFADPHSDPATFLTALGGLVTAIDGSGVTREVAAGEFLAGPYLTSLQPGELISAVQVPMAESGTVIVHDHLRFRERPALTVTVATRTADSGSLQEASVAVGSVVGVPIRIPAAEEILASSDDPNRFDEAGLAAASVVNPDDDLDGSAEYKRHLVSVVVSRVSRRAVEGGAQRPRDDQTE